MNDASQTVTNDTGWNVPDAKRNSSTSAGVVRRLTMSVEVVRVVEFREITSGRRRRGSRMGMIEADDLERPRPGGPNGPEMIGGIDHEPGRGIGGDVARRIASTIASSRPSSSPQHSSGAASRAWATTAS